MRTETERWESWALREYVVRYGALKDIDLDDETHISMAIRHLRAVEPRNGMVQHALGSANSILLPLLEWLEQDRVQQAEHLGG